VKLGRRQGCAVTALCLLLLGGCAISPSKTHVSGYSVAAERDLLADALDNLERAPWPTPDGASFFTRMTGGGGDDRLTRSEAVEIYVASLGAKGARYSKLVNDANRNLDTANRFQTIALNAIDAPRLSMNDVGLVEDAIQTLRIHRQIVSDAAEELKHDGETIDQDRIEAIRAAYANTIKALGDTADMLADQIENDRSSSFAKPDRRYRNNASDL